MIIRKITCIRVIKNTFYTVAKCLYCRMSFKSCMRVLKKLVIVKNDRLCPPSPVAAPVRCSWQGKVRSLVASGRAVNISIYEQRFMSSDVSNSFYCIKDFSVQNMLNSNQKLHCCQTYKPLLTHAITLILQE